MVLPLSLNPENALTFDMDAKLTPEDQLFLAFFENAHIGAAIINFDGNWLTVNSPLCAMLDYFEADLLDAGCIALTHPDDQEGFRHKLALLRAGTLTSCVLEKRFRHHDGRYIWIRVNLFINANADARCSSLVMLCQDINAEREYLLKIQNQATRLNAIIKTQTQLSQVQLDLNSFMQTVVERMLEITPATGVVVELVEGDRMVYRAGSGSMQSFVGMRIKIGTSLSGLCVARQEVLLSEDTTSDSRVDKIACQRVGAASMIVAPLFNQHKAIGVLKVLSDRPHSFSAHDVQTLQLMSGLLGHALGNQLEMEAKEKLLQDRSRAIDSLQNEIALRNRYEEHLREAKAYTRHIIDGSLDAFVAMNQDGKIIEWNSQAEALFGWSRNETIGQPLVNVLIPISLRNSHTTGLQRFHETGIATMLNRRVEVMALTRDRHELPVEMVINTVQFGGARQYYAFLHDISVRKANQRQLEKLAHHDPLTGLPNRTLFYDRLEQALARNQRQRDCLVVMYLDVDYFKQVNDTFGHAIGDQLLQAYSNRVQQSIRKGDTLARLGGDEFALIAEGIASPHGVEELANKLVTLARQAFVLENQSINVSTSIGIGLVEGTPLAIDQILQLADSAMYEVKKAGRNGYRVKIA